MAFGRNEREGTAWNIGPPKWAQTGLVSLHDHFRIFGPNNSNVVGWSQERGRPNKSNIATKL